MFRSGLLLSVSRQSVVWVGCLLMYSPALLHAAGMVKLSEPYTDTRTFAVIMQVDTAGEVLTVGTKGTEKLPLKAVANFKFRERHLPPAGREAASLRAVREYELATLNNDVSGYQSGIELPAEMRLVVATGAREGIQNYSTGTPLTRDASDLLELPGDSVSLLAMLPLGEVAEGETWTPGDWVAQMLTGIEAVESSSLTCKLESIKDNQAIVTFTGSVKGQRLGANTSSDIRGELTYDMAQNFMKQARMVFTLKSAIGTINPGIEANVSVRWARQVSADSGRLTSELIDSIPLEAPPAANLLTFDATPWGIRLTHDRNWHLFQAIFEGQNQIAILRLMERGSLICQCNLSPVASAAAGNHIPPEQFERDIQASLGSKFRSFVSKDVLPATDGRFIYRVVAEGDVELTKKPTKEDGSDTSLKVPMNWIYFLCADRTGRQVSFVFSIEPSLMEQLGTRDREIVESVEFFRPVTAAR